MIVPEHVLAYTYRDTISLIELLKTGTGETCQKNYLCRM